MRESERERESLSFGAGERIASWPWRCRLLNRVQPCVFVSSDLQPNVPSCSKLLHLPCLSRLSVCPHCPHSSRHSLCCMPLPQPDLTTITSRFPITVCLQQHCLSPSFSSLTTPTHTAVPPPPLHTKALSHCPTVPPLDLDSTPHHHHHYYTTTTILSSSSAMESSMETRS